MCWNTWTLQATTLESCLWSYAMLSAPSCHWSKFADTIIRGLISRYDDLAFSKKIKLLWSSCSKKNLELNPLSTMMKMHFRAFTSYYGWWYAGPLLLSWCNHLLGFKWESIPLVLLKKSPTDPPSADNIQASEFVHFHMVIIKSTLAQSIITCFSSIAAQVRRKLQWVARGLNYQRRWVFDFWLQGWWMIHVWRPCPGQF